MEIISFNNINLYEICWSRYFLPFFVIHIHPHTPIVATLWSGKFESRTIIDFIINSCKKRQCFRRSTIFMPFFLLMQKVSSFFFISRRVYVIWCISTNVSSVLINDDDEERLSIKVIVIETNEMWWKWRTGMLWIIKWIGWVLGDATHFFWYEVDEILIFGH